MGSPLDMFIEEIKVYSSVKIFRQKPAPELHYDFDSQGFLNELSFEKALKGQQSQNSHDSNANRKVKLKIAKLLKAIEIVKFDEFTSINFTFNDPKNWFIYWFNYWLSMETLPTNRRVHHWGKSLHAFPKWKIEMLIIGPEEGPF